MIPELFSISAVEVAIVAILATASFVISRRTRRGWVLGIPALFATLSVFTPADPVSTLLAGIPVTAIYVTALISTERRQTA